MKNDWHYKEMRALLFKAVFQLLLVTQSRNHTQVIQTNIVDDRNIQPKTLLTHLCI